MRAVEPSCLRGVLSVSLGPSATWEKRLEARRSSPAFLSTDLGDEDVGMGPPASPGAALQGPQGSGVIRGGEGAPLPGTARMHVCVHVCVCVGGGTAEIRGFYSFRPGQGARGAFWGLGLRLWSCPLEARQRAHQLLYWLREGEGAAARGITAPTSCGGAGPGAASSAQQGPVLLPDLSGLPPRVPELLGPQEDGWVAPTLQPGPQE